MCSFAYFRYPPTVKPAIKINWSSRVMRHRSSCSPGRNMGLMSSILLSVDIHSFILLSSRLQSPPSQTLHRIILPVQPAHPRNFTARPVLDLTGQKQWNPVPIHPSHFPFPSPYSNYGVRGTSPKSSMSVSYDSCLINESQNLDICMSPTSIVYQGCDR